MIERISRLSKLLFSIGLIATAVLMPLDLITQGQLKVEWLILLLLLQRPFIYFFTAKSKTKTTKELFLSSLVFVSPVLALLVATASASSQSLAIAYSLLLVSLLGRGWLLSRFVSKADMKLFEKTTLIVTSVLVIYAYFQFIGDIVGLPQNVTYLLSQYRAFTAFPFPRVHSLSLEPLYFANYLLLPLAILLLRLRGPKVYRPRLYSLLLVLILSLIIGSVSRSAVLGLAISLPIFLLAVRKESAYLKRLAVVAISTVLLTIALAAAPWYLPKIEFKQYSGDSLKIFGHHITNFNDDSAQTRYELWPRAIDLFKQHPLRGVGPDNSRAQLHPDEFNSGKPYGSLQPINNDYLALLAEQGLIGLLGWLPLVLVSLRAVWSVLRQRFWHVGSPYAIALIAIAVQVNSFGGLALLRTWVVIGLLLASYRLAEPRHTKA